MENYSILGIAAIPAITIICFLIAEAVKLTPLDNKWLPVIAGVCGAALGIAAEYLMTDFPAKDPLTAIAIGIVSGLAATGAHQVFHQMVKDNATDYWTGPGVIDPDEAAEEYQGEHEKVNPHDLRL